MGGKTIIRCAQCHVGSDVRLILVFKGIKKCMSCAAINGVLREGHQEDTVMVDSKELMRRMEEGAQAVNTGAQEGMKKD